MPSLMQGLPMRQGVPSYRWEVLWHGLASVVKLGIRPALAPRALPYTESHECKLLCGMVQSFATTRPAQLSKSAKQISIGRSQPKKKFSQI